MLESDKEVNIPIFVYGSLMKDFFNYDKYLKNRVLTIRKAKTKGTLFHLTNKGYPAMIEGENWIYGEVMILKDYKNTICSLDKLENFYGENKPENEYNRVLKEVILLDIGTSIEAFSYVYNEDNLDILEKNNKLIPNGNWRNFMANMI